MQDLSSLTRDQTRALVVRVPSSNHWTAREFPLNFFFLFIYFLTWGVILFFNFWLCRGLVAEWGLFTVPRCTCRIRPAGGAVAPVSRQCWPASEERAVMARGRGGGRPDFLGLVPPLPPQPVLKCPLSPAACSVGQRPLSRCELTSVA